MIKRIFWDIDECLIHTSVNADPGQECLTFGLDADLNTYYTIVRPSALEVIEYSRTLVGADNVYILTTSTRDYASEISRLAGWNFDNDHILTRETIQAHNYPLAYGSRTTLPHKTLANANNVLIDNLPPRENDSKIRLIAIDYSRYFKVRDYYGVNNADSEWKEDVLEFLNDKHNEQV
jgi:hypothetical protein